MKYSHLLPEFVLLGTILLVAFGLRFYKIDNPVADHHSWRQADTAAVARNFVKDGFNILQPKMDNMAVQSSPNLPINSERYFLAELPVYNAAVAGVYTLFGIHEQYARLVSVLASIGTIIFLFLLLREVWGRVEALLGAFFFAVIPYAIYYGRTILPEPTMLFFMVGSVYFFLHYYLTKKRFYFLLLAAIFFALALLVKIYAIFLLPAFLYFFYKEYGFRVVKNKEVYLFGIIAVLPILLWRMYIQMIPEGIPGYAWLFNQGNIRFTGAFFRWILYERFDVLILNAGGIVLLALGLILKPDKKIGYFFHFWLLGLLGYTAVIATGNVTHDYYQIIFLPIFAIFLARGASFLLRGRNEVTSYIASIAMLVIVVLTMEAFGWYSVRGFYNIQSGVDLAGAYIDQHAPKNALVITGIIADSTLLYNTNRHGWTIGYGTPYDGDDKTIEKLRVQGAAYYVTTRMEDFDATNNQLIQYLKKNYLLEQKTNQFAIFNLTQKAI